LGDTNSGLFTALATKKQGVPLYHMEAGNRCFDPQSPEEVNRRLIDSIADVHLCYTTYAKQNLMAEGVSQNKIHVIGNPIAEFKELHQKGKKEKLILATFHRQENKNNITKIVTALLNYRQEYRVLACLHPRYLDEVKYFPIEVVPSVNFSDFITLEKRAQIIVTDSGTVCEEAAMLHTPSVIIRNTTERPELFDCGSTILSGANSVEDIIRAIDVQLDNTSLEEWDTPKEYKYPQLVSQKVRNILIGKGNYASIAP
jgi:UDP-N-acetylglucosamine 2-epimerase (non-hydrolysing)